MLIHCTECQTDVDARLTNGAEIYPHRTDLHNLPFWKCDDCHNYVGCHHKTKNRTQPLGNIPNQELRQARQHIHELIDPVWQSKQMTRHELYRLMSAELGWNYHTAMTKNVEEARTAYRAARKIIHEHTQKVSA